MMSPVAIRLFVCLLTLYFAGASHGAVRSQSTAKVARKPAAGTKVAKKKTALKPAAKRGTRARSVATRWSSSRSRRYRVRRARYVSGGPWTEPTFADSTLGDNVDGE